MESYRFKKMIEYADDLSRQTLAVLYPDVIDPLHVDEINPDEFETVDALAADSQAAFDEEQKPVKKTSRIIEKLKTVKEDVSSYLNSHPTLQKAATVAGVAGLLFLVITSPFIAPAMVATGAVPSNVQLAGYTVNNNIVQLINDGHNATADGNLTVDELVTIRADTNVSYDNAFALNNFVKEKSQFDVSLDQLLTYSSQLEKIANDKGSLDKASPIFNNINSTLASIESQIAALNNTMIGLNDTDNDTQKNAFADSINALTTALDSYSKVFNNTVQNYKQELGKTFCYNLLKTLKEPAKSLVDTRSAIARETSSMPHNLQELKTFLESDLTVIQGKYKSIDRKTFTTPAAALDQSLSVLDKDLNTVKKPATHVEPDLLTKTKDGLCLFGTTFAQLPWCLTYVVPSTLWVSAKVAKKASDSYKTHKRQERRKIAQEMAKKGDDWDDDCD